MTDKGKLKEKLISEASLEGGCNFERLLGLKSAERILDEAKADFVKQSISLKDAVTILKDVDQTKIICFPADLFVKWFGAVDE